MLLGLRAVIVQVSHDIVYAVLNARTVCTTGMFRSGRTSVQADDLHRAYMEQLTAAGDGAHAEGIKRINKKQMMSALLQIPDVCDIRGDLISKRQ